MNEEFFPENPYYDPEACGLEIVSTVEHSDEPYCFDMTVTWFHAATGRYYHASDSGCSCPCPFEDINSLADMCDGRAN